MMLAVIWQNDQARKPDISSIYSRMVDASDLPERLRRAGRTQTELARHLRLDPSSLTKTIKGNRRLKADEMLAIEDFFRGQPAMPTPETIGTGNARDTASRLRGAGPKFPLYGYAWRGTDRVAVEDKDIIDWMDAPPFWNGVGELFGVRVVGVLMEPRLFEGEIAIAQVNLPPQRGRDCIIELKDGSAAVLTYTTTRDGVIFCRQWNPDSEVRFKNSDVKAVHAVIWRR